MKKLLIAFLVFWTSVAVAQWQVPNGSIPIGKGPGVIGFGSVPFGSFYTNNVSVKTGAYPAVTGDCSSTLALGGTALYSLTLSAATNFAVNCVITVKNLDTARGKLMVVNGFSNRILWPLQSIVYASMSGGWKVVSDPGMFILPAGTTTFNVANAGTNTDNDCLGLGSEACLTFQHAMDLAAANVNVSQQQFNIQGTAGETYNESLRLRNLVGTTTDYTQFPPKLRGGAGLGTATLNCGGANCITGVNSTSGWYIEGFTMVNGVFCIYADNKSIIFAGTNIMTCTSFDMVSSFGSTLEILGAWTSNGNKSGIMEAINSSILISVGTLTLGANTTANFVVSSQNSYVDLVGAYGGSTTQTGACLIADWGGGIETNAIGQPCTGGNSTGTAAWIQ